MARVYFYKTRLFEKSISNNTKEEQDKKITYKENSDLEREIKRIIELKDENNCIPIDDAPEWVILEVLRYNTIENFKKSKTLTCDLQDAEYIFGRLARKKDITNIQKRNRETFEPEEILRGPNQDIEIHTYFYLFFKTGIIVYLNSMSAPSIKKLEDMFKKHSTVNNNNIEVNPVTADDMIKILANKDIISAFELTTTLPKDDVINIDELGLDEETYDQMRNEKNITINIKIAADGRNKNLFKDNVFLKSIVNKFTKNKEAKGQKLRFKAKNSNEKIQEYDIIEKKFTKSLDFKYRAEEGDKRRKEIEDKLFNLYLDNEEDMKRYCKD